MKEAQRGSILPETRLGRWIRNARLFRKVPAAVAVASRKHEKRKAGFSRKDQEKERVSFLKKSFPTVKIIHVHGEDSLASGSDTVPTFISWDSCLSIDEDELTLTSQLVPVESNNKSDCSRHKTLTVLSVETIEDSVNKQIVAPPFFVRQREQHTQRSSISSDVMPSQLTDKERILGVRKEKVMKRTTSSDLQSDFFFCCY